MSGDKLEFSGTVTAARGNGMFLVEVNDTKEKTIVLCTLSGKIKQHNIKIMDGDCVQIEVSPYDLNKGRITFRRK